MRGNAFPTVRNAKVHLLLRFANLIKGLQVSVRVTAPKLFQFVLTKDSEITPRRLIGAAMKNSARGVLVEPCEPYVSAVNIPSQYTRKNQINVSIGDG